MREIINIDNEREPEADAVFSTKREYQPPKLIILGDIRAVTLGGSAGTGESGNPYTRARRTPGTTSSGTEESQSDPYAPRDPGEP